MITNRGVLNVLSNTGKRPTLDLNFGGGAAPTNRMSLVRASTAWYFDATGTLQSAASNVARIDYGPTPGGTTNFVLSSSAVGTSGANGLTVSLNNAVAPDGTTTASLLTETTANSQHLVSMAMQKNLISGDIITTSCYFKASGSSTVGLTANGEGTASFDLAGVVPSHSGTCSAATITAVGSGWYRCTATFTKSNSGQNVHLCASGNFGTYVGSLATSAFAWGFQAEYGVSTAGPYVATGASVPANAGATPLGLLIEESRTNGIRNNSGTSAVAASGTQLLTNPSFGSVSTGWTTSLNGGTGSVTFNATNASIVGDGTHQTNLTQSITTVVGVSYVIAMTVATNSVFVQAGTSSGSSNVASATIAVGTTGILQFTATTTTTWIGFAITTAATTTVGPVSAVSAGALPTNWTATNTVGLAINTIGTGTENGIAYTDIQWTGTTTGTTSTIVIEGYSVTAAAQNSIWTTSYYCRLVGGTNTGLSNLNLDVQSGDAGLSTLTTYSGTSVLPGANALATQRNASATITVTDATVAWVRPRLTLNLANATAVNFTLRIGLPQLEPGNAATSPIPTTSATVTRANDIATLPTGGWFAGAASPGTLIGEYTSEVGGTSATSLYIASIDDGTTNNRYSLRSHGGGTAVASALIARSNSPVISGTLLTDALNVTSKLAIAWSGGAVQNSIGNAGTVQATTSAIPATALTTLGIGNTAGGSLLNGWVRRLRYFPRMLSNADLATYTSGDSPNLDLNFVTSTTLDSRLTFTRATVATYFDATGTLQSAASGVARYDYGPTPNGVTNWIRNSTNVGAVAGTPGTLPTNWSLNSTGTVVSSVVGTGTSGGINYIDIRFSGTTSSTGYNLYFDTTTGIPSAQNQTWQWSAYFAVVAGSTSNITHIEPIYVTRPGGTQTQGADFVSSLTSTLQRVVASTYTPVTVSDTFIEPGIVILHSSGVQIDMTLRIGGVQLEVGPSANAWVPTSTVAANPGAFPLGLLIEEARTNSVSNSMAAGAVVGTPGTLPTGWSQSQNTGIVPAVIGFGTENGIAYIDLRFVGTTAVGANNNINFNNAAIAASPNQAWTNSVYLRLVGGSYSNISNMQMLGGDNIAPTQILIANPSSAPLATQRYTYTYTTNAGAVTALASKGVQIVPNAAPVAIDLTLRFGLPQIEQGAFVTSPIQTSSATVTRNADTATMPTNPSWFAPAIGSLAFDGSSIDNQGASYNATQMLLQLDDGGETNRIRLFGAVATGNLIARMTGMSDITITRTTTPFKFGFAYSPTNASADLSGATVSTATPTGVPTVTTLRLGSNTAGSFLSGYIRRARYWPRMMPNAELITTTAGDAPTLDLNFTTSTALDPRITFTRASTATYFDSTGTLQTAAINAARFDYNPSTLVIAGLLVEEARTNSIRNNTMVGAVAGTPGTLPTNWQNGNLGTLVQQIVGTGTENGVSYIEIRFSGTTSTTFCYIQASPAGHISAAQNQVWSHSSYVRLSSGSLTNVTNVQLVINEDNGGFLVSHASAGFSPTSAGLATQRQNVTATLTNASTTDIYPTLSVNFSSGVAIDLTLRIGLPQMELGGNASSAIATSSIAVTRGIDVATMPVSSAFYTQYGPGTLGAEYLPQFAGNAAGSLAVASLNNGSTTDRYLLRSKATGGAVASSAIVSANAGTNSGTLLTDVVGTTSKLAIAWSGGAVQNSVGNGGTVQATTSPQPVATMTTLDLGDQVSTSQLNGWLRRVRYWPRMMSNTELQSTTT